MAEEHPGGDWERIFEMRTSKKGIKELFAPCAIAASVLVISSSAWGALWWHSDWRYRKKLTFNNGAISENLTNFPVLVALTSTNFDFSAAQTNGADIRFIDAGDTAVLKHEIEKWDESGTNAWIWVKVPQIDAGSSTNFIYMYYGNAGASDGQDVTNVWNEDYVMVQHMKDGPGGTNIVDSTSQNNDGIKQDGNEPVETSGGKIDGALSFDGATNDHVEVAYSSSLDLTVDTITLEVWIKVPTNVIALCGVAGKWQDGKQQYLFEGGGNPPDNKRMNFQTYTAVYKYIRGTTLLNDNNWHYVVGVYDGSELRLYVDSVDDQPTHVAQSGNLQASDIPLWIGLHWNLAVTHFKGIIDEVRISKTARSANWIKAQYLSETGAYITYEAQEPAPPRGTAILIR